jgi:hypothetical protein
MQYVKSREVASCRLETGCRKLASSSTDLLIPGALASGILGGGTVALLPARVPS